MSKTFQQALPEAAQAAFFVRWSDS